MGREELPIEIRLPDGFLDPEIRCGYEVTARMKRIWAVELDLLAKFDCICRKYDIKYVALWGTALGAVRHSGFIPWDDDIDVGMDRENYNKLCSVAPSEFGYPYFFQNAYTDQRYFMPLARLRNSETTAAIKGFDTADYNNGIYIDIDILDGLACSRLAWNVQNFIKHLALIPIKIRPPCYNFWVRLYSLVRSMYNGRSKRKGISYSFLESEWNAWISSDGLDKTEMWDFEFMKVPLMGDWEEYLMRSYGEWKQFPRIEDRGSWHLDQVCFEPDVPYLEYLASSASKIHQK